MLERIQKIISQRGYCSRRKAEELISSGKVFVNNKLVNLGDKFEDDCVIEIEGTTLNPIIENVNNKKVYLVLNKPLGVITSASDDQNRKTVVDLIDKKYGRVYPVGRLDINSSGLLFLTNDGEFTNLVTHPSSSLGKTYLVECKGLLLEKDVNKLKNGVLLEDGYTSKAEVKVLNTTVEKSKLLIAIHEGRNRQVRRMLATLNHDVISLKRVAIGSYILPNDLKVGEYKELDITVVNKIKEICSKNKEKNNFNFKKERFRVK